MIVYIIAQYTVFCIKLYITKGQHIVSGLNSSPPSAAYMRHWTGSAFVQVMACRLFGTKPLPEPMLDPWEQISVKLKCKRSEGDIH